MSFLARSAKSDHAHNKVFGGHEGELFADTTRDNGRVDNETGNDVVEDAKENIGCEKGVRDINAADGAKRC